MHTSGGCWSWSVYQYAHAKSITASTHTTSRWTHARPCHPISSKNQACHEPYVVVYFLHWSCYRVTESHVLYWHGCNHYICVVFSSQLFDACRLLVRCCFRVWFPTDTSIFVIWHSFVRFPFTSSGLRTVRTKCRTSSLMTSLTITPFKHVATHCLRGSDTLCSLTLLLVMMMLCSTAMITMAHMCCQGPHMGSVLFRGRLNVMSYDVNVIAIW